MSRSTTASVRDRERQAAAQVFRARHHISQEDTMSLGSMEDITRAVGRVEQPASVRILCEFCTLQVNCQEGHRNNFIFISPKEPTISYQI